MLKRRGNTTVTFLTNKDNEELQKQIKGIAAQDGYSPSVSANKEGTVTTISVTDINGTTTATITDGEDGYTPQRGVDFWTYEDEAAINTYNENFIVEELAKRGQLKPEFANSVEECTDTTKPYVLSDGYIYAYVMVEKTYTNQIPLATDTDGSVYNGIGYKTDARLSSSGSISSANGMDVTGFIPCKLNDVIRLKGIKYNKNSANYANSHRICLYDENKTYLGLYQGNVLESTVFSSLWDDNGNLIQFTLGSYLGEGKEPSCAYIRICGDAFENPVVTINEEMTTSIDYSWSNTGHAFVPADYEDRIISLENETNSLGTRIDNLKTEENSNNIPDYVRSSAIEVARTVNMHQNEDSVVFAFLADGHVGWYLDTENKAVTQAAQAIRTIDNRCHIDFIVHGGDLSSGGASTTRDMTFDDVETYSEIMMQYTSHIPSVWCIGNHDDAPYRATSDRLTQTETYSLFGRKNLRSNAVCNNGCNYGYIDFDNKKIRVIYLDTHDKRDWGSIDSTDSTPDFLSADNISKAQLDWLANIALNFTDKDTPNEWGIIVVSHAKLGTNHSYTDPSIADTYYAYNTVNAAYILRAYADGASITVSNLSGLKNSYSDTYDFSSLAERADICCLIHGHNHAYVENDIQGFKSIGCPNVMNGRERESSDGNTYTKTADTAEGTSFCIITVDRKNKTIYADHYGAGIDRIITL